jgi:predicted NBD/HSP70 family sugar kinase
MRCIGVDIGGTKTSISLVVDGRVKKNIHLSTPTGAFFEFLFIHIADFEPKPDLIGIGVAGRVVKGKLEIGPNLPQIKGKDIVEELQHYFKSSSILCFNDAACFLAGARSKTDALGFTVGTGLGAALQIGGEVRKGFAGEISHIKFNDKPLEYYVGGKFFLERYTKDHKSKASKNKSIKDVLVTQNKTVKETYAVLAFIISFSACLTGIGKVYLGGGIGQSLDIKKLERLVNKNSVVEVSIRYPKLKHPSSLGAALLAKAHVKGEE